jgi:hypothetical protein
LQRTACSQLDTKVCHLVGKVNQVLDLDQYSFLRYIKEKGHGPGSSLPYQNTKIMSTIKQKIAELNQLVISGKAMEAFEKFYHEDVVMRENEGEPTKGKVANRLRELEFFSNISEFRGAEVKGVTLGEDISTVIWHYDYTHKEWGARNYTQVSVQHWKDGKIIYEQFFYAG